VTAHAPTERRDDVGRTKRIHSVSVLIPTYRDAQLLQKSLPVLLNNPPDDLEVVIMNNDPPQDVRRAIGDYADHPRVRLVEMGFEAGFARAINRGIRESSGGLVMFCNADLFPTAGYLAEIVSFFREHPPPARRSANCSATTSRPIDLRTLSIPRGWR